ncbi:hypothetical protein PTTG_28635 [Puccinia triticina 1-1 BBBD Race 1]|uniref:Uncharacterized protein n=1 Tax=Puccinia triticina (isolate 1-1 / race 1 (BBBD)) TaxID=630390 RepID=A0A180GAT0_PUCT1|nr:hypothetical protein PTTG_28635 [Puccinia triticina 1-1 BBBD Race 1]
MLLPAYLLILALISQLITNINASLDRPASKIWLCESRLLKDQEKEPAQGLRFPGSTAGFWSSFDSYGSPTEAISTFTGQFSSTKAYKKEYLSHHIKLLKSVLNYLLRHESMSLAHLEEWCLALENTVIRPHQTYGMLSDSIVYAFYTLLLKHHDDAQFTEDMYTRLTYLLSIAAAFPNSGIQWAQGSSIAPTKVSVKISVSMWDTLQWQLIGEPEPRLKPLVDAKNNNDYTYIIENLDKIIEEIFSSQPAKDLSAQTRVASIAVLSHLLKTNDEPTKAKANELMNSLVSNSKGAYLLFNHERTLLSVSEDQKKNEKGLSNVETGGERAQCTEKYKLFMEVRHSPANVAVSFTPGTTVPSSITLAVPWLRLFSFTTFTVRTVLGSCLS